MEHERLSRCLFARDSNSGWLRFQAIVDAVRIFRSTAFQFVRRISWQHQDKVILSPAEVCPVAPCTTTLRRRYGKNLYNAGIFQVGKADCKLLENLS